MKSACSSVNVGGMLPRGEVDDGADRLSSGRREELVLDSPSSCLRPRPLEELPWLDGNGAITFI